MMFWPVFPAMLSLAPDRQRHESSSYQAHLQEIAELFTTVSCPPSCAVAAAGTPGQYVGKPTFTSDRLYEGKTPPGVVMGLAWTAMGGSSLYIESMAIRLLSNSSSKSSTESTQGRDEGGAVEGASSGGGRLRTTGQLGDVMNESAQVRMEELRWVAHRVGAS